MININRPQQSPTSLQTQVVRDYLDELADWKTAYANQLAAHGIDPNIPKPNSKFEPQNKPNYRNSDLLAAFDEHFFAKCYLTEQKFESSYEMDVEHFFSKGEHPELRYEWSNLYPAAHDANMMKPRITPLDGYLDPCDPNDDVENEIQYDLSFGGEECFFAARNPANLKAVNTVNLLSRIHNGHDYESKTKTKGLRIAIFKKKYDLIKLIEDWRYAIMNEDESETFRISNKIKKMLSRKSDFTMFLRSTRMAQRLPPEFFD